MIIICETSVTNICPSEAVSFILTITDNNGNIVNQITYNFSPKDNDYYASILEENGFLCVPITILPEMKPMEFLPGCPLSGVNFIENFTGNPLIDVIGEEVCVEQILIDDLSPWIIDGFNFKGIIADDFCSGEIDESTFFPSDESIDGSFKAFLLKDESGNTDCLYIKGELNPIISEQGASYQQNPDACREATETPGEIELPPGEACLFDVANNDGTFTGYKLNASNEWVIGEPVEILVPSNPLNLITPTPDRDNTFADGGQPGGVPGFDEDNNYAWNTKFLFSLTNWQQAVSGLETQFQDILVDNGQMFSFSCGAPCDNIVELFHNHFISSNQEEMLIDTESSIEWHRDFINYLSGLEETQHLFEDVENKIINWYKDNNTLDGLFIDENFDNENELHRVNYSSLSTFGAFSAIGGTQRREIRVINFEHPCFSSLITVNAEIIIMDTFGAGISDGERYFPGLNQQFLLQHFFNNHVSAGCFDNVTNACYTPFISKFRFCHSFTFDIFE